VTISTPEFAQHAGFVRSVIQNTANAAEFEFIVTSIL
jgi:hypothetical protein